MKRKGRKIMVFERRASKMRCKIMFEGKECMFLRDEIVWKIFTGE